MTDTFSTKGVHFMNQLVVNGKHIEGKLQNETLFRLNNDDLLNCNIVNSELVLELDKKENPNDHNLTEIRFFV